MKQAYDEFSHDYDRFVNWEERLSAEMPFLEDQLNQLPSQSALKPRVLATACGTGMHAIALSKAGFLTAGTDISPEMVKKAQANARAERSNAFFKTAGFGEVKDCLYQSPLLPFDAVICLGNSLPHLLTPGAVRTALMDMAACMSSGGLLILQNRNFDLVMQTKQRWMGPQSYIEEDQEWLFLRFYDFDPDGLITFNILRYHRRAGEPWQEHISSVRLLPLKKEMLTSLLRESGFYEITSYGSLADVPFDPNTSSNLVITALRK